MSSNPERDGSDQLLVVLPISALLEIVGDKKFMGKVSRDELAIRDKYF
jgi:hypothetical protein